MKITYLSFPAEVGQITVAQRDGKLVYVHIGGEYDDEALSGLKRLFPEAVLSESDSLLVEAKNQILQYMAGERISFEIPLEMIGTPFQKDIWREMAKIPYGETISYGELAHLAGHPGAARATGGACHRNCLPLIIPCHRVIGAEGSLTGFGGGIRLKSKLLEIEGVKIGIWE